MSGSILSICYTFIQIQAIFTQFAIVDNRLEKSRQATIKPPTAAQIPPSTTKKDFSKEKVDYTIIIFENSNQICEQANLDDQDAVHVQVLVYPTRSTTEDFKVNVGLKYIFNHFNHIDVMQVEPCNLSEDISKDHHASKKHEDDWEATTRRKTVKFNNFVILTHNRFSYWEEDETDEPVLSMIGETKKEKIKFIERITKESKVKQKMQGNKAKTICDGLKAFETKNTFSILGEFTEVEIETILDVKMIKDNKLSEMCSEIPPKKKRCLHCGFSTKCYLNPLKYKAKDNNCSSCQRKGHFPKSRNCLKTRLKKFKQKNKCLKQHQGCQTLRNFLKCCK